MRNLMVSRPYSLTETSFQVYIWPMNHQKPTRTMIVSESELGALMRDRRRSAGITQRALASVTGVDQGNISKIERGEVRATLETYLRLCADLGIDLVAEPRS